MASQGVILVPLDGSDLAEQAVPAAAALARRANAELHLVHVHVAVPADPIYVEGLPVLDEHMHPRRREHEQAYLDGVRARVAADVKATARVIDGAGAASALAAYARQSDAQLVVLTTHGRGGLERAWLGSVAEEMARVSPVPILLVRPEAGAPARFRRVLVPLDGSPLAEAILDHAIRIASWDPEAEVVLLDVVPPMPSPILVPQSLLAPASAKGDITSAQEAAAREYLEKVAGRVKAAALRVRVRVEFAGHVAAAILAAAKSEGADLIALCTHGRSGLVRVALGSVADKVVRGSGTPILLFRPASAASAARRP